MYPTFGIVLAALLLVAAVWFVIHMIGRFPSDLAELRAKYDEYRTRNDPKVLERMESEEGRRNHQERCVMEFRGAVIVCGLYWTLTVLAALYALGVIVRIVSGIVSAF